MSPWVRNAVMMIVVLVWAVFIIASIFQGTRIEDIKPLTWGVPGGVYALLNPSAVTDYVRRRAGAKSAKGKDS